jgi:formamidopyrimidine-DNA glycosylase
MPELPEVEAARRLVERVGRGRRIARVECADDPIVFENVRSRAISRALVGREIRAARRRGKHLWLELDRRPWLTMHFGMAGGLRTRADRGVRLVSSGERSPANPWPPRFTRLRLRLDDGTELVMTDPRRLGRIRLRWDPEHEPPIGDLGFDALLELPPPGRFRALLRQRSAPIKAVLLDQSFAAGVGNWIADEVLYQARIDPRRRADTLGEREVERVRSKLRAVLATAVRAGADSDRYPRTWLFHRKWERGDGAVTTRGEKIHHTTIGGRTAAWVPSVQR